MDSAFKELMLLVSQDRRVLSLVHSENAEERFHGDGLHQTLSAGLSTMEAVCQQLGGLLESLCSQFPRLWFLSDGEVIRLLSGRPAPAALQRCVSKCFRGVRWLDVDRDGGAAVLGVTGGLREHVTFTAPVEPHPDALAWLCVFEERLKATMVQRVGQCAAARSQLEARDEEGPPAAGSTPLGLLSAYPLQCLLVAEETLWSGTLLRAVRDPNPDELRRTQTRTSVKLGALSRALGGGPGAEPLLSKYRALCLSALLQLAMKHAQQLTRVLEAQGEPEASFSWLGVMKYHVAGDGEQPACRVDVLGHRLQYDYEYFGPEDCLMVPTPSTDRAALGLLLALASYRCGCVSGPCAAGKKLAVVQLGRALGRQVVAVPCLPSTTAAVVQRMLLGALQAGAWLLLASADRLTRGVLSLLGQHLVHIHRSVSRSTGRLEPEAGVLLAGRSVSPRPSYGCVLTWWTGAAPELPESLRCASRPVALSCPDLRVLAEVMLTCIGFSEASSLARRLAALLDEEALSRPHSCSLVVLQKIVSASETNLRRSVREGEASLRVEGADGPAPEEPPGRRRPHAPIARGLVEETAVTKALLAVFLPLLDEHRDASRLRLLLGDAFPLASQLPLSSQNSEEEEQLTEALEEELQRRALHRDAGLILGAVSLYQTMRSSGAVALLGPSGSGKTTCYRVLAAALSQLAARAAEHRFEEDHVTRGDARQADPWTPAATWSSVQTVVLFPLAMSHEELFGRFCAERGWRDGAVATLLREEERRRSLTAETWLVMDGSAAGRPGWLDHLTAMCGPEDPSLGLASGETLASHLKLLLEVTDLRDAGPPAVTRCGLLHLAAPDLWKAVWESEMDALLTAGRLDGGTLETWRRLAEDLFSGTLGALRQQNLNPAVGAGGESLESVSYGLREITSFVRILRALLLHSGKEVEKEEPIPPTDKSGTTSGEHEGRDLASCPPSDAPPQSRPPDTDPRGERRLAARNLFLAAYVWGFSGHLQAR